MKLLKTLQGVLQAQTEGKQLLSLLWDQEHGDHTPLCRGEALAEGWSQVSFSVGCERSQSTFGHFPWPGIAPDC